MLHTTYIHVHTCTIYYTVYIHVHVLSVVIPGAHKHREAAAYALLVIHISQKVNFVLESYMYMYIHVAPVRQTICEEQAQGVAERLSYFSTCQFKVKYIVALEGKLSTYVL